MIEVGRELWRSSCPIPLLKQGHLESAVYDHIQVPFDYLQSGDSTTSLDNLFQCSANLTVTKCLMAPRVFHFVLIDSSPITVHHWEDLVSVFFACSFQVFTYIGKIALSLLFSRLNISTSTSSLSGVLPSFIFLTSLYKLYTCPASLILLETVQGWLRPGGLVYGEGIWMRVSRWSGRFDRYPAEETINILSYISNIYIVTRKNSSV